MGGFPLPDAVWRSNHGVNPTVMQTQEPLFNNTVYRYNLMHDLFKAYEAHHELIADEETISRATNRCSATIRSALRTRRPLCAFTWRLKRALAAIGARLLALRLSCSTCINGCNCCIN